jgi:hypothetical protein
MDDLWIVVDSHGDRIRAMPLNGGLGGAVEDFGLDDTEEVPVPCIAEILAEGGIAVLGDRFPVQRVRVEVRGTRLTLKLPGVGEAALQLDAAEVGVGDDHAADANAIRAIRAEGSALGVWRTSDAEPWRWVWLHPGGVAAWLGARDDRRAKKKADAEADKAARVRDITFINPYTFVPLAASVTRSTPRGHASMAQVEQGLSGWFDVGWTFATDYLLPVGHPPMNEPDFVTIPGASVKGAVRSVHEVLADGCLRVFDSDFLPVHRESGVVHGDWDLAVVDEVEASTGRPTRVSVCPDVVWVEAARVNAAVPASRLQSGMKVGVDLGDYPSLAAATIKDPGSRRRLQPEVRIDPEGSAWVVHLSDGGARLGNRPYYVALGRLGGERRAVGTSAWVRFRHLAEDGADQVRRRRRDRESACGDSNHVPKDSFLHSPGSSGWCGESVKDKSTGSQVGYRRRLDGTFSRGDTVWVHKGNGEVTELKPALLWRTRGRYSAGQRVGATPEELAGRPRVSPLPCVLPGELCPTCAVFGSADLSGANGGGQQHSYGAHVRFGPLRSQVPVTSTPIELPPLGSPRPGSGMFYLAHDQLKGKSREARLAPKPEPLSHWGSALDAGTPRRLAGRKYYWHGLNGQDDFPRHHKRPGHNDTQSRTGAHCVAAGTQFCGRVWFDNLTETQVGLLLAAVQPSLVLADVNSGQVDDQGRPVTAGRVFAVHLGGGKPVGLGTVRPQIVDSSLVVHTAQSRYQGVPRPDQSVVRYVTVARRDRTAGGTGLPEDVPQPWRALASALTVGRVPADRIWYPPNAFWSQRVIEDPDGEKRFFEQFDESYAFFAAFRGGGMGDLAKLQPMADLPVATDPDQSLPIPDDSRDERRDRREPRGEGRR